MCGRPERCKVLGDPVPESRTQVYVVVTPDRLDVRPWYSVPGVRTGDPGRGGVEG